MKKPCRKCAAKASTKPLFNLVDNPKQPLHPTILLKVTYFERRLKILKKVNFIFSLEPSLF